MSEKRTIPERIESVEMFAALVLAGNRHEDDIERARNIMAGHAPALAAECKRLAVECVALRVLCDGYSAGDSVMIERARGMLEKCEAPDA